VNQTDQIITEKTQNWIRSFIIDLNICPFARREVERGSVRIQISSAQSNDKALDDLFAETKLLDSTPAVETTLLVFPHFLSDFYDYLDFVDWAETNLNLANYEGVYQLATFHPDYCFADTDVDDVSNYTNRSPYPMLHLLRETSVEKAIAYYGNTDEIPERNIACLNKLGLAEIKKILAGTIL